MYAVIQTGSKQYKVAVGDKLRVEKLNAGEGDDINIDRVLMVADGDDIDVGSPFVDSAVAATVVGHGRGDKIRVFKMKRRKNYRRTRGHRQDFTEIEITRIGGAGRQQTAESTQQTGQPGQSVKSDCPVDDDLTQINGIGSTIESRLLALGITTFRQIAEFDEEKMAEVDEHLNFKGRIEREEWVAQAKELVARQASSMTDTETE